MSFQNKFTTLEKNTFIFHLLHSIIEGIISGVFVLNGFIFVENLLGSEFQLGILFTFSWGVFIVLAFTNEFIKRVRNQKRMLIVTAVITRLPALLLLFFPNSMGEIAGIPFYHYVFLLVILMYFMGGPVIKPAVNQFLKNTYRHENFGKLFGYATSIQKILTFIATLVFGLLMDLNNISFKYVYPVIGVIGVFSIYLLTKIKYTETLPDLDKLNVFKGIRDSILRMYRILKFDKPYLFFQVGFLFYGIAFMLTDSVVILFFTEKLGTNTSDDTLVNSSFAMYKNLALILTIILLPLFGRVFGKADPRKFGVLTFLFLALYLVFMTLTEYYPVKETFLGLEIYYTLILAFIFNGLFMSTMHLLWNIGSAYFCKDKDAGIYHSVHLALTGARALIFPVLGILLFQMTGYVETFLSGIFCLLVGILFLIWSYSKHKIIHNL